MRLFPPANRRQEDLNQFHRDRTLDLRRKRRASRLVNQAASAAVLGRPGQGPGFLGKDRAGFGPGMPGMGGMAGPRISLADLIDLLEQKQAAMRH